MLLFVPTPSILSARRGARACPRMAAGPARGEGGRAADWRAFRARLVALEREGARGSGAAAGAEGKTGSEETESTTETEGAVEGGRWAHEVGCVERGCLLVASPLYFAQRQQYFSQTVVFVLEHSHSGTVGVILNRPIMYSLNEVVFESGARWAEKLRAPGFATSPLYLGGPMEQGKLLCLHGDDRLGGSTKIIEGVYAGGIPVALEKVERGEIPGRSLRFFTGYAGWGSGQLEDEVEKGVWFVAAGSPDIVTQQCINLRRPLWRQVLDHMDGKYRDIVRRLDELDGGKYVI